MLARVPIHVEDVVSLRVEHVKIEMSVVFVRSVRPLRSPSPQAGSHGMDRATPAATEDFQEPPPRDRRLRLGDSEFSSLTISGFLVSHLGILLVSHPGLLLESHGGA